jgi:hypothetical protein
MNNWCICWFFTHIFVEILIFKGLTARRLYKSFGVKGLNSIRRRTTRKKTYDIQNTAKVCNQEQMFL